MSASRKKAAKKPAARKVPLARQLVLHIALAHSQPAIWRRLVIPDAFTLEQLHRVVQCAFSWLDYHLYEFRIGDRRFERPEAEAEGENAAQATVASLQLTKGARFTYVYDFGDDWEHEITVEEVALSPDADGFEWFPRILGGERAGPPEDVGGMMGYGDFLAALNDPKHPEHVERREWAPPGFDPAHFDVAAADHALTLVCAWGAI
ncbi:MAG: plasmid pRiA4b ORF-3 family protein [Gemmatimonadaceae bacterium]